MFVYKAPCLSHLLFPKVNERNEILAAESRCLILVAANPAPLIRMSASHSKHGYTPLGNVGVLIHSPNHLHNTAMFTMPRPSQDGLAWEETIWNLVPQWTRDVSVAAIESVCRQQLNIPAETPCTVTFHASGAFNKTYTVHYGKAPVIMRVTLPVYPHRKTCAEVATLRWVRETTNVPVPKVFGFDDSNNNEIGYEWILMEFMHGTPAHKRWRTMSMDQKVALTMRLATFQAELSGFGEPESTFRGIGALDLREVGEENGDGKPQRPVPGLMVSHEFFMGDRVNYDIPRGPFRSTHEWLSAELNIVLLQHTAIIETTDDEDDKEDAEEVLSAARKLLSLLPEVFPPTQKEEMTALYHGDLHLNKILVNEEGTITAILDWECVSVLPLWMLAQVPKFLQESVREEEPQRDGYGDETPEEAAEEAGKRNDPDYMDNEGKTDLYWIHKMEYEATLLRKVYLDALEKLGLDRAYRSLEHNCIKLDFLRAIWQCDGMWVKKSGRWAEKMEKGEITRFDDA